MLKKNFIKTGFNLQEMGISGLFPETDFLKVYLLCPKINIQGKY